MLQHAGMFKKPESPMAFPLDSLTINEKAWRSWLDRETMNRYAPSVLSYASAL